MRRVVITGVGLVTPYGSALDAFWAGIANGRSAGQLLPHIEGSSNGAVVGAPVTGFSARDHIDAKSLRLISVQGAKAIHGGALGEAIDKTMRQTGGFVNVDHLQAACWKPFDNRQGA